MYTELEHIIEEYNTQFAEEGGRAIVKPYVKNKEEGLENPLIMAICTPLMSRIYSSVGCRYHGITRYK